MAKKPLHHRHVPHFASVVIIVIALVVAILVGAYAYRTANGEDSLTTILSAQRSKKKPVRKVPCVKVKKGKKTVCVKPTPTSPMQIVLPPDTKKPTIINDPECAFTPEGCKAPGGGSGGNCAQVLTCVSGQMYPTACGPRYGDAPIGQCDL